MPFDFHYNFHFDFSVTAIDDKNLTAPSLDINIVLCTGCSGGQGICNYNRTQTEGTSLFKLAVCKCLVGWTGNNIFSFTGFYFFYAPPNKVRDIHV